MTFQITTARNLLFVPGARFAELLGIGGGLGEEKRFP